MDSKVLSEQPINNALCAELFARMQRMSSKKKHVSAKQLVASDRKAKRVLKAITDYTQQHGIPPSLAILAKQMSYSSTTPLFGKLDWLEQINECRFNRKVARGLVIPTSLTIPVFSQDNSRESFESVEVGRDFDPRLFSRTPHYAIRLSESVPKVGGAGTLVFVHKPIVGHPDDLICKWLGSTFTFEKLNDFDKLADLMSGVVIAIISPFNFSCEGDYEFAS